MRRVDIPRGLGKRRDACECDDRSDSNALKFYLHSKLIILLIEFFRKRQDFDTRTGFEMFAWLAKMQKTKATHELAWPNYSLYLLRILFLTAGNVHFGLLCDRFLDWTDFHGS